MNAHWGKWVNLFVLAALVLAGVFTPASAQTVPTAAAAIQPGTPGTAFRYVQTFGVSEVPYVGDITHLNTPFGLTTDASGNIYLVENEGARLLKYGPTGTNLWAIGDAGLHVWDQSHYRFSAPKDVTRDSSGNLWVADGDHVASYDANGVFRLFFPAEPWNTAPENQFSNLHGVAFDSVGRLYLADKNKNRIQVYTLGGDGVPVFAASLGSPGSDLGEFNALTQLVIDPSDNSLYVADVNNFRVQKCTPDGLGWTCTLFHGGSQGAGSDQLGYAYGLGLDPARNLLITDQGNGRIKRCTPAGVCATVIQASNWLPRDVAAPDTSTLLVTDSVNHVIKKFNASGVFQGIVAGTDGIPYVTDQNHYNKPQGLAVDPSGNVYMAENFGQRLFKFSPNGSVLWSVGTAGVAGDPPDRLCWPMGLAIGSDGKVYVAGCSEVRIYTSSGGAYFDRFATPDGSWASGVAVDASGNIYVSDGNLNKAYVYSSNHNLVHVIGTGVYGAGNDQFASPRGLALDTSGNLYVADMDNCRVQKFNSAGQYQATLGQPGVCADNYNYAALGPVSDVAVDLQGRIYVAESWINRVQVLDSNGKYLTTLGNNWAATTGGLRDVESVEVDRTGNVYLADYHNARIQKFALGVPGWRQANLNGFFDPNNANIMALETFGDYLYAGTQNWSGNGSIVMRSADGTNWTPVSAVNFGSPDKMPAIIDLVVFNGWLYAGTGWGGSQTSTQLWRTQDGTTWLPVETRAFGIATASAIGPFAISAVGGVPYLYTAVGNLEDGVAIFRSASGGTGTWAPVMTGGWDDAGNTYIDGFTEWNGRLYAGTDNQASGGEVWSTQDGVVWSQVGLDGLGDINNANIGALATFNGHVYAPTLNSVTGAQLFRLDDGATWTPVMQNGFGNVNNVKIQGLSIHSGKLYARVDNSVDGMGVMASDDGASWKSLIPPGFGTSNNTTSIWNSPVADFKGALYIGTFNPSNGGQIWEYLEKTTFIPVIKR